ncbi:uncharacterized protein [Triticum aestivum]|uniref:uncharacterized protein n=1 Tax=Triticum aestivum TaxID=4565 RepID=UPI001D016109|nr:uncharacterized protein LOC123152389 [Triticum aestivum]
MADIAPLTPRCGEPGAKGKSASGATCSCCSAGVLTQRASLTDAALMHPPPNPVKRRQDDSTKSPVHLRHGLRLKKGKGDDGDHNSTTVGRPGQGDSGPRLQGSGVPPLSMQRLFFLQQHHCYNGGRGGRRLCSSDGKLLLCLSVTAG